MACPCCGSTKILRINLSGFSTLFTILHFSSSDKMPEDEKEFSRKMEDNLGKIESRENKNALLHKVCKHCRHIYEEYDVYYLSKGAMENQKNLRERFMSKIEKK